MTAGLRSAAAVAKNPRAVSSSSGSMPAVAALDV